MYASESDDELPLTTPRRPLGDDPAAAARRGTAVDASAADDAEAPPTNVRTDKRALEQVVKGNVQQHLGFVVAPHDVTTSRHGRQLLAECSEARHRCVVGHGDEAIG